MLNVLARMSVSDPSIITTFASPPLFFGFGLVGLHREVGYHSLPSRNCNCKENIVDSTRALIFYPAMHSIYPQITDDNSIATLE